MQNAIQHPDPYFSGEEWVLGPMAGSMPDRATLIAQLQKQYVADYLSTWRAYLNAARFLGFQNWNDAAGKLSALDSNSSAILQLFSLISINTGVAQPDIANAFQAPQSVVPPSSPDNRFTAAPNQPYIQALQGLEQAIKTVSQNPLSANDPAAATPVIQAAGMADQAAENLRNSFNPDPDGKMDTISFNRLEDPIKSAEALAKSAPAAAAGGGAKAFCAQAAPVLAKFPFNPQSNIDASPDEVAQIFSPGQALDQLTGKLSQLIVLQGSQYVPNPASTIAITPAFLHFLNAAKKLSGSLFPGGGTQPSLTFTLTEPPKTTGSPDAILNIDGQQVGPGQTTQFRWMSQQSSRSILTSDQGPVGPAIGPWSVLHLAYRANHPMPNRLEFVFQVNNQINGTVHFDADGLGAPLLNPSFMGQLHCVATVAKQ
jgi:type VI secretion system protein ImpL